MSRRKDEQDRRYDTIRQSILEKTVLPSSVPEGIIVKPVDLGGGVYFLNCGPYKIYPLSREISCRLGEDARSDNELNRPTSFAGSIQDFCRDHPDIRITSIVPAVEGDMIGIWSAAAIGTVAVLILTEPI